MVYYPDPCVLSISGSVNDKECKIERIWRCLTSMINNRVNRNHTGPCLSLDRGETCRPQMRLHKPSIRFGLFLTAVQFWANQIGGCWFVWRSVLQDSIHPRWCRIVSMVLPHVRSPSYLKRLGQLSFTDCGCHGHHMSSGYQVTGQSSNTPLEAKLKGTVSVIRSASAKIQ